MPTKIELPDGMKSDKQELEIERVTASEIKERGDDPVFKEKFDLTEAQIDRLRTEIFDGYKRLQEEREANKFDQEYDTREAQYAGEMEDDTGLEFNQNVPITQVKVDALSRLSLKAFMESDPKFTITPRPAFARKDQWDVITNRQSDYLDYKLDEEIDIVSPLRKVLHQAILHTVGILKMSYEYLKKQRRREEFYSGRVEADDRGQPTQPGLIAFLKQYPEAIKPGSQGHAELKRLIEREDVTFKSRFWEVVYDDPNPSFVSIKDLFVPYSCEGYIGLCDEKLIIERQAFTWWQLKKYEKNGDFENVDKCKTQITEDENKPKSTPSADEGKSDYRTWDYTVLEATYWFNTEAGDDDKSSDDPETEVRIKCWFDVKSKAFLGAITYPYDAVDSDYIPFYCEDKKPGFYKGEFAKKLASSHLTQNAVLNLMLTESWQELVTTPIVPEGSPIVDQFLSKRWKPGVPIELPLGTLNRDDALDFLDKPQRAVAGQLLPIIMYLARQDDLRTGINDAAATGNTDPTDPTAPAAKTAMLLQQSGINISDYINCLLPSFNRVGEIILQMTYQMAKKSRSFRTRQLQSKVVGGEIFGDISRDDMIAKTNIQSRAAGFDFDKLNEKRENLALFQLMFPILSQTGLGSPQAVYTLCRTLVQTWSPLWKNKVDTIIVDPATFQQDQFKICVQALGLYMQGITKQAQVTGVPPKPDMQQFLAMATQMMKSAVAIPPKQEAGK